MAGSPEKPVNQVLTTIHRNLGKKPANWMFECYVDFMTPTRCQASNMPMRFGIRLSELNGKRTITVGIGIAKKYLGVHLPLRTGENVMVLGSDTIPPIPPREHKKIIHRCIYCRAIVSDQDARAQARWKANFKGCQSCKGTIEAEIGRIDYILRMKRQRHQKE